MAADSVYKVIQIIGTSSNSWAEAGANAVRKASETLRDIRVAEVEKLDLHIEEGGAITYRAKLNVSFKFEGS